MLVIFLIASIALLSCRSSSWAEPAPALVVAVFHCDYAPVSFWNRKTDTPSGFFVDIMDSIAGRSGLAVKYICRNGWPEMINAIESGEADVGVLMKSAEREKIMLFSAPIEVSYLSFFARSQSSIDTDTVPAGYTVGVVSGSMSYEQLKKRPGFTLQTAGTYQEGIFSLLAGKIDLFAGENSMILKSAREAGLDDRVKKVGEPFVERERCLAVGKADSELLERLNKSLQGFVGSPEYQRIYLKWYGAPTPYWTSKRLLIAGGSFLFIAFCGMALWRYLSLFKINKELMRNIAERKQAEQELRVAVIMTREEKAKTEAIIAAMGDAVSLQNIHYKILYQNGVSKGIYGDHIGEYCYRAYQNREHLCERCHLTLAFSDGGVHTLEQSRATDAGTRYYEITASPVRDFTGTIIAGIELVRDITERKRAEEVLRRSRNELEILVRERTAELMMVNDQLRNLSVHLQNAREDERTRIAREIHDDLGQSLTALKMDLSRLAKRPAKDRESVIERAKYMTGLVDATIESVKRISTELRPGMLDHLGLTSAIEWQAEEFEKRTGISCRVVCEPGQVCLDKDRTTTVFRIFQETLTNAARHAQATKICVLLKVREDGLTLQVEDDGRGITKKEISDPNSLGLIGIRERVTNWGGSLEIAGSKNKGTVVTVQIPLDGGGSMP